MTNEVKILLITGITTVLVLIGGVFFITKNDEKSQKAAATPVNPQLLVREDSNKIATASAKVTVVEFSDLQCPACGAAYPVVKRIRAEYQGKINFVYRHFPLPQHQFALIAAESAEAAAAQGKFWQFHDKLFESQKDWSDVGNPMEKFIVYAKDLGLDADKLKQEAEANKYADKIQKDIADGNALGVSATPTFYINGLKQVGGLSYEDFKGKIETELAK